MTVSSQWIIAGLCAFILLLAIVGTVKYVKELNKIRWDDTHEEME